MPKIDEIIARLDYRWDYRQDEVPLEVQIEGIYLWIKQQEEKEGGE